MKITYAKYSEKDASDKIYVDCTECERGRNGQAKNKCSCGWKVKKAGLGCFLGTLKKGMKIK